MAAPDRVAVEAWIDKLLSQVYSDKERLAKILAAPLGWKIGLVEIVALLGDEKQIAEQADGLLAYFPLETVAA